MAGQPASRTVARVGVKKGGVPGAVPRQMEDRLRRCVAAADVAVDYFFVAFAVPAGLAEATCFGAAARVTLSAILWPLSSLYRTVTFEPLALARSAVVSVFPARRIFTSEPNITSSVPFAVWIVRS